MHYDDIRTGCWERIRQKGTRY